MKDNLYKFLKFLNRNKYIAILFVFALSFFAFKNIAFAASCSMTNIGACFDEIVGGILTSIALFFISFSSYLFGLAFPVFLNITGWLLNSGPINTAWILVRDLVNMFFIFFLLFTSLAKLVGQEKKLAQHSASKQIVYILLSAFLINFSKVICGVIVDIAQIVTLQFTNAFVDSLQNLNSLFSVSVGTNPSILLGIIFVIFALAFLATSLTSLLYILIRAVSLGIYAALSPLWFLWLSFPTKAKGIEQMKSETMDKFFEAAIGGPILAFYLWISLMLINTGSDGSLTDNVRNAGNGTKPSVYSTGDTQSTDAMTSVTSDTSSATILKMIVASAVLLFANKQAMSMAKKGGTVMGKGVMDGVVNKVGQVGMKPLDGLKNTASSIAKDTVGNVKDTVGGGIRNGINLARGGNNGLSKMLDSGFKTKENMAANAIARQGRISERASQTKALDAALKSGDLASIKKAKDAISTRQINQGKKVKANIDAEGGLGNYVGNRAKKYGKIAAVTGAALATGGIAPAVMGIGAAAGAVLTGAGAAGALGKFGIDGANRQSKAEKEKTKLESIRQDMANHPERFTKANVDQITAEIGKQDAIIKAEKERQKLAEDRQRLHTAKSAGMELDSLKKQQEKSVAKSFVDSGIQSEKQLEEFLASKQRDITDLNNKMSEVRDPEVIAKLKERANTIQSEVDKMNKDKKTLDRQGGFNASIGNYVGNTNRIKELENNKKAYLSADDISKQEANYIKAEAGISKAGKNIDSARDKAAGLSTPEEKSAAQKAFDSAMDKIKNDGDNITDFKLDASKINSLKYSNNADKFAAMLSKVDTGGTLGKDEQKYIEQHEKDFVSVVEQLDKSQVDKFNKLITSGKFGSISQEISPKAKGYIANIEKDITGSINGYKENILEKLSKDNGLRDELEKMVNSIESDFKKASEEKDGYLEVQDKLKQLEALTSMAKSNKNQEINNKSVLYGKNGITEEDKEVDMSAVLERLREAKKATRTSVQDSDVSNLSNGINVGNGNEAIKTSMDESSMRSLAADIATNISKMSSGNDNNQPASIDQLINNNKELSSHLDAFANNFTASSDNFIKTSLDLVSNIKDEKQKEDAMAVIMQKLIGKVDNLGEASKAYLENIGRGVASGHDNIVENAFNRATNNIASNGNGISVKNVNIDNRIENDSRPNFMKPPKDDNGLS